MIREEENQDTSDVLLEAIQKCLKMGNLTGTVTGFVVIASFVDDEGEGNIYSDTLHGQRTHESLGLLHWGVVVETKQIQLENP